MKMAGVTTQSTGLSGPQFWVTIIGMIAMNLSMLLAAKLNPPLEIVHDVIWGEGCLVITAVLGRSGVHVMEAWTASRTGSKVESKMVKSESTTTMEPK